MELLAAFQFADVAAPFGLSVRNVSGGPEKSYIVESTGAGGCFLDFDGDGDLDLYLVNGGRFGEPGAPDVLYRNEGGARFVDVTEPAEIRDDAWGGGCAVGDVDNDGDPDLYVANFGRNRLHLNRGDGTFVEHDGVDDGDGVSSSAAFADLDLDGSLDLVVGTYISFDRRSVASQRDGKCLYRGVHVYCGPDGLAGASNRLYRNRGDATFENVTESSGVQRNDVKTLGLVLSDLDGDGRIDIYAACDSTMNLFLRNLGGMRFEDGSLLSGAGYSGKGFEQSGMGAAAGDPDGDGDLDLFVTNFQNDTNTFYRNLGHGEFEDVTDRIGLGASSVRYLSWGAHFADFDNDGDEDLVVASGHVYPQAEALGEPYRQGLQLFENRWPDVWVEHKLGHEGGGRGTAVGDVNDDGRIDVFVNRIDETPGLLLAVAGNTGGSLKLLLVGTSANRQALGARVELRANDTIQHRELRLSDGYLGSSDHRMHFGVGEASAASSVRIAWPGGDVDRIGPLEVGFVHIVKQGSGVVSRIR